MHDVITVNNTQTQQVGISQKEPQKIQVTSDKQSVIGVSNTAPEQLGVSPRPPQKIVVGNTQQIRIGVTSVNDKTGKVVINYADVGAVPIKLSILPQVTNDQLNTRSKRQEGKVYIEINNKPSTISLEQIKQLATKTLTVDSLDDSAISTLSDGDYIYLRKEIQ